MIKDRGAPPNLLMRGISTWTGARHSYISSRRVEEPPVGLWKMEYDDGGDEELTGTNKLLHHACIHYERDQSLDDDGKPQKKCQRMKMMKMNPRRKRLRVVRTQKNSSTRNARRFLGDR